jgi:hypothetical protein
LRGYAEELCDYTDEIVPPDDADGNAVERFVHLVHEMTADDDTADDCAPVWIAAALKGEPSGGDSRNRSIARPAARPHGFAGRDAAPAAHRK